MGPPASHCLERCDGGRDYRFRSPQALRALLGLSPPYDKCLAHAPYARNAPHCSRPVNRAKAASVPSLLGSLQRARVPSTTAEVLLKTLSTHAVCGITGWHQNKAVEVYLGWQRELWEECLHLNGLDPRQWGKQVPSMTGWACGLNRARREQGWEDDENEDEDTEDEDTEDEDTEDGDIEDDYTEEEFSEENDSDEDDIVSLSGGTLTDSDVASDFDGRDISFDIEEDDSSSEEIVATPDTTISDLDGDSPDFTDSQDTPSHGSVPTSPISAYYSTTGTESTPDTVDEPPAISAGDAAAGSDESEVQEEGGSSDVDEFTTHLLDIDVEIFQKADTAVGSASVPSILSPGPPAPASPPAGFCLYPQAPSPASQLKQLLNLMTQTVSQQRRYTGVLYGFARPSAQGMLKIGVVKDRVVAERPFADPVDHRLATWQAQCGHPVVEVFRRPIACAAAERIESLVHLALREYRRVEDPPCGRCERRKRASRARTGGRCSGGKHDEWFEVDVETAKRAVELWTAFAEQLPYDRYGRLLDFWSAKVEAAKARIRPGDTVKSWQEAIPRLIEECTRTELEDLISRLYV
ncbi:hypothetical protein B0T18DRAFT_432538 [Schizothecium vesticola]|uniref:Bacteriophage T5 Orf172 DNA-binding domain-containing protein n=1 Tax=Schizothecium vesticola TaxID=314040 RepID=A0AA40K0H2_9PEZI|nr:hypothetical protein B0T18DRAFT_432538 [Schizothecium vesticola]